MIRRFFNNWKGAAATSKFERTETRRSRRRRPAIEGLEQRNLLSLAGMPHQVSMVPGTNYYSSNASSANGTPVAVWFNYSSTAGGHIYAQRFDTLGDPIGSAIEVDSSTASSYSPSVAMDASGRFIVTWQDQTTTNPGAIDMRAYSSAGTPLTGVTRVSAIPADNDFSPTVAASNSSFVIAWSELSATNADVVARRYTYSSGVPVAGNTFIVDRTGTGDNTPSVAMSPDGRFDVAYEHDVASDLSNIYLARYSAAGVFSGTSHVSTDQTLEYAAGVSMDNNGNAVVAYTEQFADNSFGVFANRVTSAGAVGSQMRVAYSGLNIVNYGYSSVALSPTSGEFVVAFNDLADQGVDVERISAQNTLLTDNQFGGTDGDGIGPESGSSISVDGMGRFLVTFTASPNGGSVGEIFSHRALMQSSPPQQVGTLPIGNSASRDASSSNGTSVVVWQNDQSVTNRNIYAQRFDNQGNPVGPVIAVDTTAIDSYNPAVAMDATGRFIVTWQNLNSDGNWGVMMREYSAAGTPITGITQISSQGMSNYLPSVASSNGSFVISWDHFTSDTNDDIRAERFVYSNGMPQGQGVFIVNGDANSEEYSSVAMSPDGRFDIVYQRQYSGNDWDIFASQYSNTGTLTRQNIEINFDSNTELYPSVSMDNAGNAVVAYMEEAGTMSGVFANRLSASGVVGARITVANGNGARYTNPSVALSPTTGAFVVAVDTNNFFDPNTESFTNGVYAVEFSSNDTALEPVFNGLGSANDGGVVSVSIDSLNRYMLTFSHSNGSTDDVESLRDFLN